MPTSNVPFAHDPDRLDQHFLHPAAAEQVTQLAHINPESVVLDIGAGTGHLTAAILRRAPRQVVAIEPDPRCLPALARLAATNHGLTIVNARFRDVDPALVNAATTIRAGSTPPSPQP